MPQGSFEKIDQELLLADLALQLGDGLVRRRQIIRDDRPSLYRSVKSAGRPRERNLPSFFR